eukprot:TRINITY_DN1194_c0_g1_i2.p2 TRINITY_DN1194_c0_g1~~TRINITY_DN1194_c0_g1_i2.p2  ORF type:complete len:156 (+),score=39.91 TRINITY_DN1194_c0_g1_i2:90-557(+)
MARCIIPSLFFLFLVGDATTLRGHAETETVAAFGWWPFFGMSNSIFNNMKVPQKVGEVQPLQPTVRSVKDSVILSSVFGHKTAALCKDALPTEMLRCRELAGDRLFCALMRRQLERFEGMQGFKEEDERCRSVDMMENSVEAAKDEMLQQEANKA